MILNAFGDRVHVDPRHYQIAVLGSLLAVGMTRLGFDLSLAQAALTFAGALGTQAIACRALRLPFDWRSPLITGLSLCLLLRTDLAWLALLAAVIGVGSKFVLRMRGRHLFNPANVALTVLVLCTPHAWVSPGQWGEATLFAFTMAGVGMVVVTRAQRADVTLAFLGGYAALIVGRALWLGDPLAIVVHQLQSGALLLFAFFMISDPATTPRARSMRIVFGLVVAAVAFAFRFELFRSDGVILALTACALLTPALDALHARTASSIDRATPRGHLLPQRGLS